MLDVKLNEKGEVTCRLCNRLLSNQPWVVKYCFHDASCANYFIAMASAMPLPKDNK